MRYEVEQKFHCEHSSKLLRALRDLGGQVADPVVQHDAYFTHPLRDFGETDEALRVRRVGGEATITYKGPKVDQTTKTRAEIEIDLSADQAESAEQLIEALGFGRCAVISKRRRLVHLWYCDRAFDVALDKVAELGTFVELETIAEEADVQAARDCLHRLANELDLDGDERASYLELYLDRQRAELPSAD